MARAFDHLVTEEDVLKMRKITESREKTVTVLPKVYRNMVLNMLHDHPTSGHLGTARTLEKVSSRFFWPTLEQDVSEHCETCLECQRRGHPTPRMQASLRTESYSRPFERVALDITEMPMSSRGNRYVLVIMDYFSKYVYTYPMANQTAETVADCLFDMVLKEGVPERLHSDRKSVV